MYRGFLKRSIDIIFSLLGLIILSPIFLIVYLSVILIIGRPAFFKQERVGKNERIFRIYKFRTMTDARDKDGALLSDEERLTGFGKMLRATSLDELPELFNILKGDMSFVGPRPLLVEYLPYYTKKEHRRHDVRPGLSGLSQVNGRNLLGWDDRLAMDIEYVKKVSFLQDFKIVFSTFVVVFKRSGISDGESATMKTLVQERSGKRG
ncbi:sugar transferase [Candidatus Saccharibacteria bacterium]|nr:sugar transferase [Candidatus Saccharibacteria bacterium]